MNVPRILLRGAICFGLVGCLVLTVEMICSRKSMTFFGHTSFVGPVAISPDGKTLASGSCDRTVKLWDVATGQERATLQGHTKSVEAVAFSPDGKIVASGSGDGIVKLWDVATGKERAALQGHTDRVSSVAFSPDSKTLASGSDDSIVTLWNVATAQRRATLQGHTLGITYLAFSSDGKVLASGSWDDTVKLWGVAARQQQSTLRAHPVALPRSAAFSPDGKTLAVGIADRQVDVSEVMLWDVATGRERKRLALGNCMDESYIYYLTFSRDGRTLAAIETYSTIHLWDIASGDKMARFDWDDDGRRFLSTGLHTVIDKVPAICERHQEHVNWKSLSFSSEGKLLALGSGRGYTVKMLDIAVIRNTNK